MPFFQIESWLNSNTFSFLVFICLFALLLYFIDSSEFISRIQSFKFGSSGFEITLAQAQKAIIKEERESQPEKIKEELDELRDTSQSPLESFILIDNKIEEKIKSLADINNIKYRSIMPTTRNLIKNEKLDETTYSILNDFRPIRNEIIHNYHRISKREIDTAIELGELLISRLTLIYVQDVPQEKADAFIQNSESQNPKLKYTTGNSKSGKSGYVGIYYTLRKNSQ